MFKEKGRNMKQKRKIENSLSTVNVDIPMDAADKKNESDRAGPRQEGLSHRSYRGLKI